MYIREGTAIVTQQEKVPNGTRQQMNNLFQRLCSVSLRRRRSKPLYRRVRGAAATQAMLFSILSVVEKGSLVICDRKFSFSHRTSRVEPSPLLRDNFLKDPDFPGKIDNIPLPGVSLEVSLPLQYRLSKKSLVRFLYGAGPLATSSLTWPLCGLKRSLLSQRNS